MKLKINGTEQEICEQENYSLSRLIEDNKLNSANIVIEYNFTIIPQQDWDNVILKHNDNIEIVSFVGGG